MIHYKNQLAKGWTSFFVQTLAEFSILFLMVRSLPVAEVAHWKILQSIMGSLVFLQLGVPQSVSRFLAEALRENDNPYLTRVVNVARRIFRYLGLSASFIMIVVGCGYAILGPDWDVGYSVKIIVAALILAFHIFVLFSCLPAQSWFHVRGQIETVYTGTLISSSIRVLVGAVILFIVPTIELIAVAWLLGSLCQYLYFTISLRGSKFNNNAELADENTFNERAIQKKIFSFSGLALMNTGGSILFFGAPIWIGAGRLSPGDVVLLSSAIMLAQAAMMGLSYLTKPMLAMGAQKPCTEILGRSPVKRGAECSMNMVASVGMVLGSVLLVALEPFLVLWLGREIESGLTPFVLLLMLAGVSGQVQSGNYFLALGGGDIRPTVFSQVAMALTLICALIFLMGLDAMSLQNITIAMAVLQIVRGGVVLNALYASQFKYSFIRSVFVNYAVPLSMIAALYYWVSALITPVYPFMVIGIAFSFFVILSYMTIGRMANIMKEVRYA